MPLIALGGTILGGIFGASNSRRASRDAAAAQQSAATTAAAASDRAAAAAAEQSRFVPYGINSAFSQTSFTNKQQAEANAATAARLGIKPTDTEDGRYGFTDPESGRFLSVNPEARNNQSGPLVGTTNINLGTGLGLAQQVNERSRFSPEDLAKDRFSRYMDFIKPSRESANQQVLSGIASQGQLGAGSAYAGGGNPIYAAFVEGNARADRKSYEDSIMFEQGLTDQLQARGARSVGQAGAAEALGRQDLELAAGLGGRGVNSSGASAIASLGGQSARDGLSTARDSAELIRAGQTQFGANVAGASRSFFNNPNVIQGIRGLFGNDTSRTTPVDNFPRFNVGEGTP